MGVEFSFPTQKAEQAGADILNAATQLERIQQSLLDALSKASGGWEGNAADSYLGKLRSCLEQTGEAPKVMCANIGNRLLASAGNYAATEDRAASAMETVMNAFS